MWMAVWIETTIFSDLNNNIKSLPEAGAPVMVRSLLDLLEEEAVGMLRVSSAHGTSCLSAVWL